MVGARMVFCNLCGVFFFFRDAFFVMIFSPSPLPGSSDCIYAISLQAVAWVGGYLGHGMIHFI